MYVALVVDDDPDLADVIVFMLERAGFQVHLESEGDAGLAIANELRPDLVLLDWMMPNMSGLEICRALRSNNELMATRLVILSARAQKGDIEMGMSAGADDYIVKPFKPKDLIDRLEAVLARPAFALMEETG